MKKLIKNKKQILILIVIMVSFIGLYAGHFLLQDAGSVKKSEESTVRNDMPPVKYEHLSTEINGYKQEIDILEIDLNNAGVEIKPVLSYDSVFGFEKLSVMASRNNAYAAVNAGFFYEYGQPAGMVVIDGKIITNSTGRFPVFQISTNKAVISELDTKLWLTSGDKKLPIDNLNIAGKQSGTHLYSPEFGSDNGAKVKNISLIIENNIVKSAAVYSGKVKIPSNGMLLTFYNPASFDFESLPFKEGDKVEFSSEPALGKDSQFYECGSWIVRDRKVVIGNRDEWVGVMTNHDPRTAVGIKGNGQVVLMTVDGRQPGYSIGLTGKELGEFLLSRGVIDAAMLDGGASTEMIINNKVVNRPSYDGTERLLGGGIIVTIKN